MRMIRTMFSRAVVGLCLLGVPGIVSGCSSSDSGTENQTTGTLTMPLVTNAGGHTYRLSGDLYVNGPLYTYASLGGDNPVLTLSLPTGNYSAYLYSWYLERLDDSGVYVPVEAYMTSNYWVSFTIFN